MKVGIIGAGFSGLSSAYKLAKNGAEVTVFEMDEKPGGLAVGFEKTGWKWSLEKHYHHWFYSDMAARNLAKEIGQEVVIEPTKTSTFLDGDIFQLDSPLSLLRFGRISFWERMRTGIVLAYFKLTPFWKPLERITTKEFLEKYMGEESWRVLWEPLFQKKFSAYADSIPASWFWARIKKRSIKLCYPAGGFLSFAKKLEKEIKKLNGKFLYGTKVESVEKDGEKLFVKTEKEKYNFDSVICTLPSFLFLKVVKGLSESYIQNLSSLKGLGAVNLVLSLRRKFLSDGTYWLSIGEMKFPFLAIVEHTNFMKSSNYGGENIVYIGKYLSNNHEYFQKDANSLLAEYMPYLKKINPSFSKDWIIGSWVFKTPFAQPIVSLNYSKIMPSMETPIANLFLANIEQVYPWDRGTNYAIELGEKAAEMVLKSG
jgi:protoporphyrinogen oxidase